MIYVIYVLVTVGVLIVALLWWLYSSVTRGARERDEKLLAALDPIAEKLLEKEPVTPEVIADLCRRPQYRPVLYEMLKYFERLDLFPPDARSIQGHGAGILAYWMMHPNELQHAPAEIELVEVLERNTADGKRGKFLVFRYRMPPGHWAEKDGWLLGLAGPFLENDVPYSGVAAAFSRCDDKYGEIQPAELIDWFLGIVARKRG